jgi:hypothetical protein
MKAAAPRLYSRTPRIALRPAVLPRVSGASVATAAGLARPTITFANTKPPVSRVTPILPSIEDIAAVLLHVHRPKAAVRPMRRRPGGGRALFP